MGVGRKEVVGSSSDVVAVAGRNRTHGEHMVWAHDIAWQIQIQIRASRHIDLSDLNQPKL